MLQDTQGPKEKRKHHNITQVGGAIEAKRIVLPLSLDTKENRPVTLNYESYLLVNKDELTQYLSSLQSSIGASSFSVDLGYQKTKTGHAISVHYDATTKRWLLLDPNFLPGVEFLSVDLLVERYFAGQDKKFNHEGRCMIIPDIWMKQQDESKIKWQFKQLEQTNVWHQLHHIGTKEKMAAFEYLIVEEDQKVMCLSWNLNAAILQKAPYDSIQQLIEKGAKPNDKTLIYACQYEKADVNLIKLLIKSGAKATKKASITAHRAHNFEIAEIILAALLQDEQEHIQEVNNQFGM